MATDELQFCFLTWKKVLELVWIYSVPSWFGIKYFRDVDNFFENKKKKKEGNTFEGKYSL